MIFSLKLTRKRCFFLLYTNPSRYKIPFLDEIGLKIMIFAQYLISHYGSPNFTNSGDFTEKRKFSIHTSNPVRDKVLPTINLQLR